MIDDIMTDDLKGVVDAFLSAGPIWNELDRIARLKLDEEIFSLEPYVPPALLDNFVFDPHRFRDYAQLSPDAYTEPCKPLLVCKMMKITDEELERLYVPGGCIYF